MSGGAGLVKRKDKNNDFTHKSLDAIFSESDILFVALADDAGNDFITLKLMKSMKADTLLVSISHAGIINENDLSKLLVDKKIRAAVDIVKDHKLFKGISYDRWYGSNSSAAYNSTGYLKRSSDMAVENLLSLLKTGKDKNRVN